MSDQTFSERWAELYHSESGLHDREGLSQMVAGLEQQVVALHDDIFEAHRQRDIVALQLDQAQRQASLLLEQSSQRGDEIKILTAKAQALEAAASWQPIATAPKDGTEILLFRPPPYTHPRAWMVVGQWKAKSVVFLPADYWMGWPNPDYPPTHWMPLPAPPAASRCEEEPR